MKPVFTHCALHVRSMDASIAFYERYCGLKVVHSHGEGDHRTVWLGAEGRETDFVLVLVPGGEGQTRAKGDMNHYGFALSSREDVDRIAGRGKQAGCLYWEPQEFPDPVGYLCALQDPDGYVVEFSHGQPLGPGRSGSQGSPARTR